MGVWVGGLVVGLVGNKANLSPSSVGARVGAELGNKKMSFDWSSVSRRNFYFYE